MPWWMWLSAGWLLAVCLVVFVWGCGGFTLSERRGGELDLSAAAARGELDLDWSDPRKAA